VTTSDRSHAMDHVVLVLFENRSLDNLLGHLYGPEDGKTFEGVIGKDLSNPVPDWAENQPPDGTGRVSYEVATDMDAPNPDSGEEWFHTNTQLYNTLDDHNRGKIGAAVTEPFNVPPTGTKPTMEGFVTDYISVFEGQIGRQPTFAEYRQIMTGFTPEQVPVLSGLAKDFGVFDHWYSEVPSQTFMNRSFWTAATCTPLPTGGTVNSPSSHWMKDNTAETIFDRLEAHGKTWKVYVNEGPISFTGFIHMPRLKDKFATHFVPFEQFEKDAAAGELPDFSFIEPNLLLAHGDYHPAFGMSFVEGVDVEVDPLSSIVAGEAFLDRLYGAYRNMRSETGSNVWNTTLFISWDEPGGTYDHVAPGEAVPPEVAAPAGQFGFAFDRSGYRVPAIVLSPWVESGSVYNAEHRHTSMIATMRKLWDLGEPFTERDKAAEPFDYVFSRETARDPDEWAVPQAIPVPDFQIDWQSLDKSLSGLGKAMLPSLLALAKEKGIALPPQVDDPDFHLTAELAFDTATLVSAHVFPGLGPDAAELAKLKEKILIKDLPTAVKPETTAETTQPEPTAGLGQPTDSATK